MHCGIPTWINSEDRDSGDLIFGSGDKQSFGELFGFDEHYDFFTYNLSVESISSFDFPFSSNNNYIPSTTPLATSKVDCRGTLSNWWSGDEPLM